MHSPIDGSLEVFPFRAIKNKATVTILYMSFCGHVFTSQEWSETEGSK